MGTRAARVFWVASDITQFEPQSQYDVWYDRAAFHFLTSEKDIDAYKANLVAVTKPGAHVIIGAFSENGPTKCSGIEIKQYSQAEFEFTFNDIADLIEFVNVDHTTPFGTIQNFNFAVFRRK